MTAMPELEGANCTDIPNVMDGNTYEDVYQGLDACVNCPALDACSRWVNSLMGHTLSGVVAGKVWGDAKRYLSNRDKKIHGGAIPRHGKGKVA